MPNHLFHAWDHQKVMSTTQPQTSEATHLLQPLAKIVTLQVELLMPSLCWMLTTMAMLGGATAHIPNHKLKPVLNSVR